MKITGQKAQIFIDSFNGSSMVNGNGTNQTEPKQKYLVIAKGENSNVPVIEGAFFMAPEKPLSKLLSSTATGYSP